MSQSPPAPHAIVDAEKLAALKELAYGASHEINNPLANIAARAQTLLRDEVDPERRRALEAIHLQSLRAHEMISDLMLFARPPQLQLAPVDPAVVVRQVVAQFRQPCHERGLQLSLDAPAACPTVQADANQLAEAVRALVLNAVEAVGVDGRVAVSVRAARSTDPSDAAVAVEIADNGRGLTDREAEHAFDPFFSGREAGRGLGFGLAKCWRIVTAHGGNVQLQSGDKAGAVATLTLPVGATHDLASE
ncbi:MAG: hypothetical protein KDA44_16565 [Planctomycetales bacterium]|nr:hypothetical protein [Planctomycetales bacterium]